MKKVPVHYDEDGQILSTVEVTDVGANLPGVSIIPEKNHKVSEIELTDDLAKTSLLDIHTKFKADVKQSKPTLVSAE
jgi:kynurenine formamidase